MPQIISIIKQLFYILRAEKWLLVTMMILFGCLPVFAQDEETQKASANAMVTIITPVILIKEDINFHKTAVSSSKPVAIGGVKYQSTNLLLEKEGLKAAAFTILSEPLYLYNISLPPTPITVTSGAYTITLRKFTNDIAATDAVDSQGAGNQTLYVSASLYDRPVNADGKSVSPTPFDITVNYN